MFRLSLGEAVSRHLDSVIATVAHQMGEWVSDFLDTSPLSSSVASPSVTRSTFLPNLLATS